MCRNDAKCKTKKLKRCKRSVEVVWKRYGKGAKSCENDEKRCREIQKKYEINVGVI